jgi:hypothetical protein
VGLSQVPPVTIALARASLFGGFGHDFEPSLESRDVLSKTSLL